MVTLRGKQPRAAIVTRWIARGLVLVVLGFWLWFAVCETIYYYPREGWAGIRIHLIQIAVFLALLALAWFFDLVAGAALIVLAGLSYYLWGRNIFVALVMCLPLLVTGALFVTAWVLGRQRLPVPPAAPLESAAP